MNLLVISSFGRTLLAGLRTFTLLSPLLSLGFCSFFRCSIAIIIALLAITCIFITFISVILASTLIMRFFTTIAAPKGLCLSISLLSIVGTSIASLRSTSRIFIHSRLSSLSEVHSR